MMIKVFMMMLILDIIVIRITIIVFIIIKKKDKSWALTQILRSTSMVKTLTRLMNSCTDHYLPRLLLLAHRFRLSANRLNGWVASPACSTPLKVIIACHNRYDSKSKSTKFIIIIIILTSISTNINIVIGQPDSMTKATRILVLITKLITRMKTVLVYSVKVRRVMFSQCRQTVKTTKI